jgi:tetratricopeptide (TPR) repeat protein
LKNFQRAVQLDSRFAYAHTLCGHEYSALEDYENSLKFYRCALQVDEGTTMPGMALEWSIFGRRSLSLLSIISGGHFR